MHDGSGIFSYLFFFNVYDSVASFNIQQLKKISIKLNKWEFI